MSSHSKPIILDFDDLCDNTVEKLGWISRLKDRMPELKVTLFTIPARTSDATIRQARDLGPWVALGMHGWIHTLGECWSWTREDAVARMQAAAGRGIDAGVFRAPKWVIDAETYLAARDLDWVIADHRDFRVGGTGARTYTYNATLRNPPWIRVHGHLPDVSGNGIAEHFDDFLASPESTFRLITEIV
jgi:hypothetical protein